VKLTRNRSDSRQDAKNAKFGIVFSFAVFASLREIFRAFVAAQPSGFVVKD